MSLFLRSYTKALRAYDKDLFAERTKDGIPCVFRKVKRFVPVCEGEGFSLKALIEDKQFIFAITDTWKATGVPRDWGIDDVVGRIRRADALANNRFFEELDQENEKIDLSKKKDLRNQMESFWSHERKRFAKATDDILTHSLSKDEPKKRLKDRSIRNGNY